MKKKSIWRRKRDKALKKDRHADNKKNIKTIIAVCILVFIGIGIIFFTYRNSNATNIKSENPKNNNIRIKENDDLEKVPYKSLLPINFGSIED